MPQTQLPLTDLAFRAQALLFAEGDSLSIKKLSQMLECEQSALLQGLAELKEKLKGTGLSLVQTELEVALAIAPETGDTVRAARAKEASRDIGDAGLEVLGILLYEGPSTRADIDYIRGVNSTSTLRALLARGLIDRIGNPLDGREYLYQPTVELLAHLGVTHARELPDYATIASELATFKASAKANEVFQEVSPQNDATIV
jgi:segregation and condensation protein B